MPGRLRQGFVGQGHKGFWAEGKTRTQLACDEDTPAEPGENVSLTLDEGFQSRQSMLPLIGNEVEVRPDLFERLRPELEPALASDAQAAHDTSAFQYSKMLGDRLAG